MNKEYNVKHPGEYDEEDFDQTPRFGFVCLEEAKIISTEYVAEVRISVTGEPDLEKLKDYLQAATSLDIDVEEKGEMGVGGICIKWDTLKKA